MWSSLDYAGLAQLCERSPIMRKIMRAHNRIIPPSLGKAFQTVGPDTEKKREPKDSFTNEQLAHDNMTTANDSSICSV